MLKRLALFVLIFTEIYSVQAQVKSPEEFLGYKVGSRYTPHWKIVNYFQSVTAASPGLVKLQQYGETIYNTTGNLIAPQKWGVVTGRNKKWYAHIINTPESMVSIFIPGVKEKVNAVTAFAGKEKTRFKQDATGVTIFLDTVKMDDVDTVIQLVLK